MLVAMSMSVLINLNEIIKETLVILNKKKVINSYLVIKCY